MAQLSRWEGCFNVVMAAFITMLATFFLFQFHSRFLCGDTDSLLLILMQTVIRNLMTHY